MMMWITHWILQKEGSVLLTWRTLIPKWTSNGTQYNVWGIISNHSPNFNGRTVEVCEWINNSIQTLLCMQLLIHAGVGVNARKGGHRTAFKMMSSSILQKKRPWHCTTGYTDAEIDVYRESFQLLLPQMLSSSALSPTNVKLIDSVP